jgi:hypothetical protein
VDAARYSLARSSADSSIDLDLDLLITKASNDNPVYYVQYAHARTCRMKANAADLGMSMRRSRRVRPVAARPPERVVLLRALAELPRWSPAPPSCASRTASRATSRTRRGLQPVVRHQGVPHAAAGRRAGRPATGPPVC